MAVTYHPRIEAYLNEIEATPTGAPLVTWARRHPFPIQFGTPLFGAAFAFPWPFRRIVLLDNWGDEWLRETLAHELMGRLGAPDLAAARAVAEEEVAFAASLCDQPRDTLIAVRRTFEDGAIREAFRTLRPRGERKPMRAFSFLEVDGEEEPGETVDLAAPAKGNKADPSR